ncbi:uncharacterized protein TM35_000741200 [Trypanosoma theileri]|uniref:Uncharacterized protein n=1 Tax=Trypanosoma theileri TaxID=67003 RepID=A0A1X0NFY1_9TRYP|nr:uncharacterized protein TM35_000741200 [Trypanosoma theileri]ORC83373.1 hypothetical protein TM35_000741200 [Trypanosoma theileri]
MAAAESQPGPQAVSPCQDGEDSGSCAARTSAASGHAANSCGDGGSGSCPAAGAAGGVECTQGSTCNSNSSIRNAARTECADSPSGADSCPTNDVNTQASCGAGETNCKPKSQEETDAKPNANHGINGSEHQGPDGQSRSESDRGSVSDSQRGDRSNPTVAVLPPAEKETAETQSVNGSQDAGSSSPAAGTGGAPAADGQTESNVASTTEEGGSKQGDETVQPSPSPTTSDKESGDGSDAANAGNDSTTTGSVSTNNQDGAGNADTDTDTTTTTTLPPELSNNKKGDADSSSSISSSVWVRVPLLIVAVLFSATAY